MPTRNPLKDVAKREAEVGRLVAEGLSNKQIGARLFISDRTVATHMSSIMNKLGLNSRAQIAVWMTSFGPEGAPMPNHERGPRAQARIASHPRPGPGC